MASTTLLGTALWWATPFEPWEAAGMSLVIAVMGFAGGMTMSAIKRDRGVKDYGTLVAGHGGVLDRIDSICFAAPVFYHLTKLMASMGWLNLGSSRQSARRSGQAAKDEPIEKSQPAPT